MRVWKTSGPWRAIAVLSCTWFTETSVGEYINRRGTVVLVAFGPGLMVSGSQVRRHSVQAVPPSVNSATYFCTAICFRPAVPPAYATDGCAMNVFAAVVLAPHCVTELR